MSEYPDHEICGALRRVLEATGGATPADVVERLAMYVRELARWSRRMSLTTLEPAAIVERLVEPSLALAALTAYRSAAAVADLGSGGGIPGVPLQIIAPRPRFVLIEARQRRAAFLRHVVRSCALHGAEVVEGRAESIAWPAGRRVDLVVSRAVAPVATVLPWCEGLVRPRGLVAIAAGPGTAGEAMPPDGWEVLPAEGTAPGIAHVFRRCST